MTIPVERGRAISNTEQFLCDLLDPKKTPRVPSDIRRQARWLLKHYPGKFYLEQLQVKAPGLLGKKGEV